MKTIIKAILILASCNVAWATVGQQPYTVTYTCTGSAGPFVFNYPISDPTSMTVTINGSVISPTAYTIVPINNNYDNGGNVTLGSPCASSNVLVLNRFTAKTQTTVYVPNMPPKTTENDLDKNTEIDQEIWGRTVHSIQLQSQGANIGIPSSGGDITFNFTNCGITGSQTGAPPITENLFTFTCAGGSGGGDSGTLGQPMYGTGPAIISQLTELNVDQFPGADICAQTTAAIAALPSSGGTVRLSCKDYTVRCSAPISWNTGPSITLKGCGDGQVQGIDKGATNIHFNAGVPGISIIGAGLTDPTDPTNPTIEDLTLSSDSVGAGSDNGIHIKYAGNPVIRNVSVKGFGGKGVYLDEGNDRWSMDRVDVANNFGDGFYLPSGCTDINVGHANLLSSTLNGGWGFNLNCGVTNTWTSTHASGNASGCWNVNVSYNTFDKPYCEGGDNFVINSLKEYNDVFLPFFGEPTIVDNGVPYTNRIRWTASAGVPGLYPADNFWSISNNPSIVTRQFYQVKVLEPGDSAAPNGGLTFQDTVNLTPPNQAITILNYNKTNGWTFPVGPVTIAGPGQLSLNVNATPSLTAGVFNLFGPVSSPLTPLGFQMPTTIGTVGQALVLASVSGGLMQLGYGSGGGGSGTIATTPLVLKGDNAGNAVPSSAGDIVNLFSGCSGTKYLGADSICHSPTGISNSASLNNIPRTDASSNLINSGLSDNTTQITSTETFNAPQITTGSTPPNACPSSAACWAGTESSTTGTPTAGVCYIRPDATTHNYVKSCNGGGESLFGVGTVTSFSAGLLSPLFTTNVNTATSTPALTFALSTAAAHNYFGNNTGSTGTPGYFRPACADLSDASAFCNGTAAASLSVGSLANGMTATTQTLADNSTKLATTAYVDASVATGSGTGFNGGAGTTYQDAAAISAPANPGSGCRLYIDSGTGNLAGKKSSGASCIPAGSLADPGANGVMTRTSLNVTAVADAAAMAAPVVATSVGGTANAITLTMTPALAAQTQVGTVIRFTPSGNNTITNPTIAVSGLTALTVKKKSATGLVALASGDIVSSQSATIELDPTVTFWVLTNPQTSSGGGSITATAPLAVSGSNVSLYGQAAGASTNNTTTAGAYPLGISYPDQRMVFATFGGAATPFHVDYNSQWAVGGTGSNGGGGGPSGPRSGNFVTAASANASGGLFDSNDTMSPAMNPRISAEIELPSSGDTSGVVVRVGIYSTITASTLNTADPSGVRYLGFRYVAGTDTNWKCEYANASGGTFTDSGIGVTNGVFYKLLMVIDSTAGTVDYYIANSHAGTPARVCGGPLTYNTLSSATLNPLIYTLSSGSAVNIKIAYFHIAKDW